MAKWSKYNLFIRENDSSAILFNTRTGALIKLNSARLNQIRTPETLPTDFLQFLLSQGFLIGDSVNELELIERGHIEAKKNTRTFRSKNARGSINSGNCMG